MDTLTRRQRSYCMAQIKRRDTTAEKLFRKYLWSKGIRGYRTKSKIAGKPDLYFAQKRLAVFIDGCFWHKCPKCFIKPKSNLSYWIPKIRSNVLRDKRNAEILKKNKIAIIRFWEHEVKDNLEKCYNKFTKIYEKRD